MLSQLFCPTCGGPALQQAQEISCSLCGNQALPESEQAKVKEFTPPEMPAILEFEASDSDHDHTLEELGLAFEYFLGFMESYPKLPQVRSKEPTRRLSYTPTPSQSDRLLALCSRFEVSPQTLATLAIELYAQRDS